MKSTFIHIDTAVMIGQLHLKGYELLVYALVSGLSKGGSEWVKKPLQWYADTLCDEKKSIGKLSIAFNNLVGKGLLEMTRQGHNKYYRITCQKGNFKLAEKASLTCQKGNFKLAEKASLTCQKGNFKLAEKASLTCQKGNFKLAEKASNTLLNNIKNNITLSCDNNAHARGEKNDNTEKLEKADQPNPSGNPENPSPLPPSQDALSLTIHDLEQMALRDLQNNCEWTTSLLRLYNLSAQQLQRFLTTFTLHLSARGEAVKSVGDYRRHLNSWLKIQTKNHYGQNTATTKNRRDISRSTEPSGADF